MQELDVLLEKGVREKVFSGAVARVSHGGRILYERAVGHDGTDAENQVHRESIFDLASLTKVLATTLVAMRLLDKGVISLDLPLCMIFPEWGKNVLSREIRLFHLLQHTSGLPPFLHFFETLASFPPEKRVEERQGLIAEIPLVQAPGKETVYSDIGFMLLKEAFVEMTGKPFERLVFESLPPTLSRENVFFFPSPEDRTGGKLPFVTTSFSAFRNRRLFGEVHDENAAVMGGVDGHAGLFGTAAAVGLFAEALLDVWYGKDSWLKRGILEQFVFWPGDGKRPLGFDRPSAEAPSSGRFFSPESIGHLGFTGTSLWIDIPKRLVAVLLTNRVYYGDDNWKIREFRPAFHNLIVKTIGLV